MKNELRYTELTSMQRDRVGGKYSLLIGSLCGPMMKKIKLTFVKDSSTSVMMGYANVGVNSSGSASKSITMVDADNKEAGVRMRLLFMAHWRLYLPMSGAVELLLD